MDIIIVALLVQAVGTALSLGVAILALNRDKRN